MHLLIGDCSVLAKLPVRADDEWWCSALRGVIELLGH